jgi:hypothetical protein
MEPPLTERLNYPTVVVRESSQGQVTQEADCTPTQLFSFPLQQTSNYSRNVVLRIQRTINGGFKHLAPTVKLAHWRQPFLGEHVRHPNAAGHAVAKHDPPTAFLPQQLQQPDQPPVGAKHVLEPLRDLAENEDGVCSHPNQTAALLLATSISSLDTTRLFLLGSRV